MTSNELLLTQGAILVLLFGVLLLIVRSSAHQIAHANPPPLALKDPVTSRAAVPARPAPPPPAPPPPAPAPVAVPVAVTAAPPETGGGMDNDEGDLMGRSERASFDFDANLSPRLVVEAGPGLTAGIEYPLESGLSIGRSEANDLSVDDAFISHMHARILRRGPFFYVEDLGSTNGTFLNGQRISGDAQLRVHDELRMGETVLRYEE